MTAWEGLNRRKFPRVNFPCLVIVRPDETHEDVILTHTENIGKGGICATIKKSVKISTPVRLELDLIDGHDHVKCEGKVVWVVRRKATDPKKPQFYDIGVEFVGIPLHHQKRIEETVNRLAKKDPRAYR